MYATLNTAVYFLRMTVVLPLTLSGAAYKVAFLTFSTPSFIYGLDALGYRLMSLATLFAAFVFAGGRLERWIRGGFNRQWTLGTSAPVAAAVPCGV
jgi:hypothetical protein